VTYLPAEVLEFMEPYWRIVAGAAMLWLGSQATYKVTGAVQVLRDRPGRPFVIGDHDHIE
jgi:hypothetical protein